MLASKFNFGFLLVGWLVFYFVSKFNLGETLCRCKEIHLGATHWQPLHTQSAQPVAKRERALPSLHLLLPKLSHLPSSHHCPAVSWVPPSPLPPPRCILLTSCLPFSLTPSSLSSDTPRASPRDVGPVVWGAGGGILLVLLLLAGGSLAFILLRVRRRRKSPGGGGDGSGGGSYDPKTQVFGNGGPVFWTPTAPGPLHPEGKDEEDEEEEEDKAEKGLMLPRPPALEDDMESQLDGSLISRRAVYV